MQDNKPNPQDENARQHEQKDKKMTASQLDAITNNPTESVRSRRTGDSLSNTGTNITYEGATAPAGGGSVGTGQASGKDATDPRIATGHPNEQIKDTGDAQDEDPIRPDRHNDELDRDTLGTP